MPLTAAEKNEAIPKNSQEERFGCQAKNTKCRREAEPGILSEPAIRNIFKQ
jgi:hypothetical protein